MGNLIKSKAIESTTDSRKATMKLVVTIDSTNIVNLTAREISEGNFAISISYLSIIDFLESQRKDNESLAMLFDSSDKAQVLASALVTGSVIEFSKLDGTPIEMYTSGIHTREYMIGRKPTGLFYNTITWYTEPSKTILGKANPEANVAVKSFIEAQEALLAEIEASLKAKTAKVQNEG